MLLANCVSPRPSVVAVVDQTVLASQRHMLLVGASYGWTCVQVFMTCGTYLSRAPPGMLLTNLFAAFSRRE